MKKSIWGVGVGAVVICGLGGCGSDASSDKQVIKIGAVIDRTGNNSSPSWGDAIALAETHMNQALARGDDFKNLAFDVVVADSANDPATALQRATELFTGEHVKALATDTTQNDIAIVKTMYDDDPSNDLAVPVQCSGCTSSSINSKTATNADPPTQAAYRDEQSWNYRNIYSGKVLAFVVIRQLLQAGNNGDVNGDGQFSLSLYVSDEAFGNASAKELTSYAQQLHPTPVPVITLVKHDYRDVNGYNWSGDLEKIVNPVTNPPTPATDAVVMVSFAQCHAALVRAYVPRQYGVRLMHVHTFRIESALQSLGNLAEGQEGFSNVVMEDNDSGRVFAEAMKATTGVEAVYRDAQYYDNAVTFMLATLIASAGLPDPTQVTGEQVRDAMAKVSTAGGEVIGTGPDELARAVQLIKAEQAINYEGASGPVDFDPIGDVRTRMARYVVSGGKFVDMDKFDCVKSADCERIP